MNTNLALTRRDVVAASAGAIAASLLPSTASAEAAQPPRVRSEVRSAAGRQMLELYRLGVQRMQAMPPWNPRSWRYQANMHEIHPSDATPEAQNQIFNPNQSTNPAEQQEILAARALAFGEGGKPRLWGGCRHNDPHFLSWHRWYVFYFERIVESHIKTELGTQRFALPYWDYSSETADARILPPEFRTPQLPDETPNPLWYRFRNPQVNRIANPEALDGADVDINLAFIQRITLPTDDNPLAFSNLFEGTPHGSVHVSVGNSVDGDLGMADVPFAARDPIFWLHHANIDRVWEVWRRAPLFGRPASDPTGEWLTEKFSFADADGKLAPTGTAGDTLKLETFGYTYPGLPPMPAVPPTGAAPALVASSQPPRVIAATPANAGGRLSAASTTLRVRGTSTAGGTAPVTAGAPEAASGRVFLQVQGIQAESNPATNFDVFVRSVPTGGQPAETVKVGRFSLFGVAKGSQAHAGHGQAAASRVIDITNAVRGSAAFVLGPGEFEVEIRAVNGQTRAPVSFGGVRILAQ